MDFKSGTPLITPVKFFMDVPFFELKAQYQQIKSDVDHAIREVFENGNFIRGEKVKAFENAFSKTIGTDHCIGVGNGTDALFLILKAYGIGAGDEVITPAFSWISSSETITQCGATPVFADVDDEFYTLDPIDVEKKITSNTKAIIAVHLYGQVAEMNVLRSLCKKHNLKLIEDCAQAHLSQLNGKIAGSLGHATAFSFYPTKNLGAYGDAGCVTTNDSSIVEFMRRYANHGALEKDDNEVEGINSRLDELQAAVLLAKLKHLPAWTQKRIQHASLYLEKLKDIQGIVLPKIQGNHVHSFHLYVIQCKRRDVLKTFLREYGIETSIHYPKALHNLPAYQHLQHKPEDFPVSNALQNSVLSLPIYPELTSQQIEFVCSKILEFYSAN